MPIGHYERHPGLQDGVPDGARRCSNCREVKPRGAYSPDRRLRPDGLQAICKVCRKGRERAWREANPEETARRAREGYLKYRERKDAYGRVWRKKNPDRVKGYALKKRYGITRAGFMELLAAQEGRCALCGTDRPGQKGFHVDHDHTTGRVRGLLCAGCNVSLGVLEKPGFLAAARRYLRAHASLHTDAA